MNCKIMDQQNRSILVSIGVGSIHQRIQFEKEIIVAGGQLKSMKDNVYLLHCLEAISNDNEHRSLIERTKHYRRSELHKSECLKKQDTSSCKNT